MVERDGKFGTRFDVFHIDDWQLATGNWPTIEIHQTTYLIKYSTETAA